jgi:hypothetical protein
MQYGRVIRKLWINCLTIFDNGLFILSIYISVICISLKIKLRRILLRDFY